MKEVCNLIHNPKHQKFNMNKRVGLIILIIYELENWTQRISMKTREQMAKANFLQLEKKL